MRSTLLALAFLAGIVPAPTIASPALAEAHAAGVRSRALAAAATPTAMATLAGSWTEEPPTLPSGPCAVRDPLRDRMIVVGGDSTWAFDLGGSHAWTRLITTGSLPSGLNAQRAILDAPRDRVLVFGAVGTAHAVSVWSLALASLTWSDLTPAGSGPPAAWWYPSVTCDPVRQRALVIGGYDGSAYTSDVWALSLTGTPAWTHLAPVGTAPAGRAMHAAAYDSLHDRIIVHGGVNTMHQFGMPDVYLLDLGGEGTWLHVSPTNTLPSGFYLHSAVYDAARDRMLMFGGLTGGPYSNTVWSLSAGPTPTWTALATTGEIAGRAWHSTFLDPVREALVVFGGRTQEVFQFPQDVLALPLSGGMAWTQLASLPTGRVAPATAIDTQRGRLMVFGGNGGLGVLLDDLWAYDLHGSHSWTKIETDPGPAGRRNARMIYDPDHDRLVLFGGVSASEEYGDTWVLPLAQPAWTNLSITGPAARHGHTLVLDEAGRRAIVYGGMQLNPGFTRFGDAWTLNLDGTPAWTLLSPSGTPPDARMYHAAAFEAAHHRMIVHGGIAADSLRDDLWELRFDPSPSWHEFAPWDVVSPGIVHGRYSHALVDDPTHGRLLLFGGSDSTQAFNDVWQLDLSDPFTWTPVDMGTTLPEARNDAGVELDPATGALLVFGSGGDGNDVWLAHADGVVAADVSLVAASAVDGVARITWYMGLASQQALHVQRRGVDTAWEDRGTVLADGGGQVHFEEGGLAPGSRVAYRLQYAGATGAVYGPEVWLDVPLAATFALAGATPNPASSAALLVSFSLADARPARLELFDLAGRRVAMRDVGALGAGTHRVPLAPALRPAPGLYWLTLRQGGRLARTRVAIVD